MLGLQVSLQSLPCRLGVADFPGSNVLVTQPSSSQQTVTLVSWLVQRVKGIRQVVLGNPEPRSVLATIPLPDPADDGSYSKTHLLLFLLSFAEVEESLELVICQMGMLAASAITGVHADVTSGTKENWSLCTFAPRVCCCMSAVLPSYSATCCCKHWRPNSQHFCPTVLLSLHSYACSHSFAVLFLQIHHFYWMKLVRRC